MAGDAPSRDACPGDRMPAWWSGAFTAAATTRRIVVLRFDLSECAEPSPGRSGDGCWCQVDHATALERDCSSPHIGPADKCPTLLRSADGLARWSVRANDAQTGR